MSVEAFEAKLKRSVPSWSSRGPRSVAIFKGMAEMLAALEQSVQDTWDQTYILKSTGKWLDLHGADRDKSRLPGETLNSFRKRVQTITNSSSLVDLKRLIDNALIRGESTITEWFNRGNFYDRGAFLERNLSTDHYFDENFFIVYVQEQIPDPELSAYYDRGFFMNRDSFIGGDSSDLNVLENVINIVEENKAFGVVWELRER